MIECGICLEEYEEGDLELHRQMCEVRLMFRCSLCAGDYVNKEGLWNHLDLHEIADENKEQYYQEIKAKHKLHQCVLCNDQRAYSEISYWKHVHDVHDDFFLKCSDCGENFQSEKLKNDHASSRCKARDPMEEEQVPIKDGNMTADAERLKLSWGDQSSNTIVGPDNRLSMDYADKNISDKESELPPINLPLRFPCDICGKSCFSKGSLRRHKAAKYACMEGRLLNSSSSSFGTKCFRCNKEYISAKSLSKHIIHSHQPTKCEICGITFEGYSKARCHKKQAHAETQKHTQSRYECVKCTEKFISIALYKHHTNVCDPVQSDSSSHKSSGELIIEDKSDPIVAVEKNHKIYSCKLCGSTFKQFYSVKQHTKRYHPDESSLENIPIVQDQQQVQNIDLKMEITVEETTILAPDDQGLSSVNPSSDVLDSRSYEHSSACLNEDEIMDNRVIDEESQMVYVAPLDCSSTVESSQPLGENLSNQPYFCNICCMTMHKYSQFKYHSLTKHKEGRHQCPNCSRKFHYKSRLEEHVSRCASFKHSCELCGQKFKLHSSVEDHKKRVHQGSRPLRDANIEGADCTEEKKQGSVEKIDAAEQMISCIVCRISVPGDELIKHMLNCAKHTNEYDDSKSSTEDISLLHDVSGTQADSTIVSEGEIFDVKLEIEVEETLLQEQKFQVLSEKLERSSVTTLQLDGDKSKDDESEDVDDLENGIKVKEECLEDEEETQAELRAEHQATTISNQKTGAEEIRLANLIELGYVPVKSCSFEDAKSFVRKFEYGFGFQTQRINKKGNMRYYRCLRVKQIVRPQCERRVLMLTSYVNEKSTVYAKGEHSCTNAPPKNIAVPAQIDPGYVPVKSCSFEDAKLFVENFEFGFGVSSQRISQKGNMRYYRCLRIKGRVLPQCERKLFIYTPNTNENSTVCAKGEHSCINAPSENMTVPAQLDFSFAPVKTCSIEDAKSFVKNLEFGFCYRSEKIGKQATMQYYFCSRIKQGARPQCKRRVLICTPFTNEESTVYAKGEHSCMNALPKNLKRAPVGYGYALVKTCSFEDAKSFVTNFEFGFTHVAETCREKGNIRKYRCSRFKRKVRPQCKRKVLIFTPDKNKESTVCAKGEHSCINAPPENLVRVKAKPSVEQADITIKSGLRSTKKGR